MSKKDVSVTRVATVLIFQIAWVASAFIYKSCMVCPNLYMTIGEKREEVITVLNASELHGDTKISDPKKTDSFEQCVKLQDECNVR